MNTNIVRNRVNIIFLDFFFFRFDRKNHQTQNKNRVERSKNISNNADKRCHNKNKKKHQRQLIQRRAHKYRRDRMNNKVTIWFLFTECVGN